MAIWKDIKGYEGRYQISDGGEVKSLPRNRSPKENIIAQNKTNCGYKQVRLRINSKPKYMSTHRLVLMAFVGSPPKGKPDANHIDGDKTNNHVSNLEWCSKAENMAHAKANGLMNVARGFGLPHTKLSDEQVRIIRYWWSLGNMTQKRISIYFNVCRSHISCIVSNTRRVSA